MGSVTIDLSPSEGLKQSVPYSQPNPDRGIEIRDRLPLSPGLRNGRMALNPIEGIKIPWSLRPGYFYVEAEPPVYHSPDYLAVLLQVACTACNRQALLAASASIPPVLRADAAQRAIVKKLS